MKNENINIAENDILEDERIDAYLRGEMSAKEEQAFMAELQNNPELKDKAVIKARMIKAMRIASAQQANEAMETLRSMDEDSVKKMARRITHKARIIPMWLKISIAAVCLALCVFSGIKYVDYRDTQLLADNYAVYVTHIDHSGLIRGNIDEFDKESSSCCANDPIEVINELFDKVRNDKVDNVTISELEKHWKSSSNDSYKNDTQYASKIGYALAIAYLRNGDKDKAKKLLSQLKPYLFEGSDLYNTVMKLQKEL